MQRELTAQVEMFPYLSQLGEPSLFVLIREIRGRIFLLIVHEFHCQVPKARGAILPRLFTPGAAQLHTSAWWHCLPTYYIYVF